MGLLASGTKETLGGEGVSTRWRPQGAAHRRVCKHKAARRLAGRGLPAAQNTPVGGRGGSPRRPRRGVRGPERQRGTSPGERDGVRRTTVRPSADLVFSRKLVLRTRLLADSPSGPWSPERGSGQPRRMSRLGWIRGWVGVATCD